MTIYSPPGRPTLSIVDGTLIPVGGTSAAARTTVGSSGGGGGGATAAAGPAAGAAAARSGSGAGGATGEEAAGGSGELGDSGSNDGSQQSPSLPSQSPSQTITLMLTPTMIETQNWTIPSTSIDYSAISIAAVLFFSGLQSSVSAASPPPPPLSPAAATPSDFGSQSVTRQGNSGVICAGSK